MAVLIATELLCDDPVHAAFPEPERHIQRVAIEADPHLCLFGGRRAILRLDLGEVRRGLDGAIEGLVKTAVDHDRHRHGIRSDRPSFTSLGPDGRCQHAGREKGEQDRDTGQR